MIDGVVVEFDTSNPVPTLTDVTVPVLVVYPAPFSNSALSVTADGIESAFEANPVTCP